MNAAKHNEGFIVQKKMIAKDLIKVIKEWLSLKEAEKMQNSGRGDSKSLGKSVKSKYLAGWMEVIIKVMKWFGMKLKRDDVKRTILDIYMGISSEMLKSEDGTNSVICSIQ